MCVCVYADVLLAELLGALTLGKNSAQIERRRTAKSWVRTEFPAGLCPFVDDFSMLLLLVLLPL